MTQTQDAPVYDASVSTDEGEGGNRRNLIIVAVLAAVLLAAAGWFLLGGGGGGSADQAGLAVPSARKPVATTPSGPAAKPAPTLPPASTVKLGRDPFKPQYVVPAAPAVPASGAGGVPAAGGTGSTGTTEPGSKPVATTYALKLSRVDGSGSDLTAKFLVGSEKKIQFARAGSVFGKSGEIRLLSIQKGPNGTGTAVIQVGDDSPFDVSTSDATIFVQ
ncbi:MAG: hypothetical protein JWN31_977 [Frankiales bacterium]|nr:hypothetical protein [Frankiales bacterium]